MMSVSNSNSETGLSLLEVMVAVSVVAITAIASLAMLSSEWTIIRKTGERLHINRILESRLEEIRDLNYDELLDLPQEIAFNPQPATNAYDRGLNPQALDPEYQVELHDAVGKITLQTMNTDLTRITVAITWNIAGGNREGLMNAVTYMTRNGVTRE